MTKTPDAIAKVFMPNYTKGWRNWIVVAVGVLGAAGACYTVYLMFDSPIEAEKPVWARNALIYWTVLPPLWFWAEYWLLWRSDVRSHADGALERLKYAQELGRNVWLAFVALLAAFYFK